MTLSLLSHHIFKTLSFNHYKVFFFSLDPLQQISPPLLQNHAPESRSKTTKIYYLKESAAVSSVFLSLSFSGTPLISALSRMLPFDIFLLHFFMNRHLWASLCLKLISLRSLSDPLSLCFTHSSLSYISTATQFVCRKTNMKNCLTFAPMTSIRSLG
jgi:hypothetical protein